VDVTTRGGATLQMANGKLLDRVPERYLETALPKVGGNAIVLVGKSKFAKGKLLERDSRSGKGIIQVFEDMSVLKLSLDDMAEWVGPLDDDMME
jgi:G patch domain/KOW motif-containing protein